MAEVTNKKFHKTTFDNIPQEKREQIFRVATEEFAEKGLSNARIKDIVKRVGISYGSMYNYFPTRDDLIRTIIEEGWNLQQGVIARALEESANSDVFERIEALFRNGFAFAGENPNLIAIWLELSHGYNSRFTGDSLLLEEEGILFWKRILEDGVQSGRLRPDLDLEASAFYIDNALSALMKSRISELQTRRLLMYFQEGERPDFNPETAEELAQAALERIIRNLKNMFGV